MPRPILSLCSRVARDPELVCSNVDGQVALLSIKNGSYYGLDAVGSRIWELIDVPSAVSEICARLVGEYNVDPSHCERHVLEFLQKLSDAGLLRIVDEAG